MLLRHAILALALTGLATLPLAGCDTDNPGSAIDEIAGTYGFTELRFVPTATALTEANVLEELDSAATEVRIDSRGRTLFFLEFEDGESRFAEATATASSGSVLFRAVAVEDQDALQRVLLPPSFRLERRDDDRTLGAELTATVNLQEFDPVAYAGQTAEPGTLHIRLERR